MLARLYLRVPTYLRAPFVIAWALGSLVVVATLVATLVEAVHRYEDVDPTFFPVFIVTLALLGTAIGSIAALGSTIVMFDINGLYNSNR